MLGINLLAVLGWPRMKDEMIVLLSNRHFVIERYQVQMLHQATAAGEQAPILMALHPSDRDVTYPAWTENYTRDIVSAEAFAFGYRLDALLAAAIPANYLSDVRFDFGSQGGEIDLLDEVRKREARPSAPI
ncbi:MAG TPA: hypothetical protein VGN95_13505 [Pyrinomonadaceae bacterium]|jgi:hypothetical protein|nr:hypothetical protein [Pyrinomonadaceae bacterium]